MTDTESQSQARNPSAGQLLKEARTAKGMTVADIAAELHLDIRMVEALEADDSDKLPATIFVRGYIKSYARRVGLDEHQVLNAYQPPVIEEEEPEPLPRATPPVSVSIAPLFGLLAAIIKKVILLVVLVGIGWGMYQAYLDWQRQADNTGESDAVLNLPSQITPPQDDAGSRLQLPESVMPEKPPGEAIAPEPAPAVEPAVSSVEPQEKAAVSEPAVAEPDNKISVKLHYGTESWTDIRDAEGNKLVYGLIKAGTTRSFSAEPPIRFVIGNADAVEMEVDGQPYDHSGYNRNNVARFRIEH